jgi:enamine deaminase RidA (YjgF/YER057c/UK114 family)
MTIHPLEPPRDFSSPLHAQGVVAEGVERFAFVSGQVGVRPDGASGDGIEEQTRIAFENVSRILAETDLHLRDVVSLRIHLIRHEDIPAFTSVARELLDGHRPASTLLVQEHLAAPGLLVQVEAIAVGR